MATVLDEIIAGVLEDQAEREAKVPFAEIKAKSLDVPPAIDALEVLSSPSAVSYTHLTLPTILLV